MHEITRRAAIGSIAAGLVAGGVGTGRAQGRKKIGWTVADYENPFFQLMVSGAKKLAAQANVEVVFADGKDDPSVQASQIDNFLAQRMDGVIISPAISDPLIPSVKKINAANIPLAIVDRRIFPHGQKLTWDCLVSFDMTKSGTVGGEQAVKALDGKGNLVVIAGTPGAGSTIDRANGFQEEIKKHPDIKVVANIPADFNRAKGQSVTEDVLQRFPKGKIDAIYFMNDEMFFGGLQAIKAANRLHEFKTISCDGEKEALDLLRAGDLDYDTLVHPDDEAVGVSILADILNGKNPDLSHVTYDGRKLELLTWEGKPWVRPDCYWVDRTNANLPENQGW